MCAGQFTIDAPNTKEMGQLSALIQGMKQYQNDEHKAMQAEFDRVEQLLLDADVASVSKQGSMQSTSHGKLLVQENISEDQARQNLNTASNRNQYRFYIRWTLLFLLLLFFGVMLPMCIGNFLDHVANIYDYLSTPSLEN